jgi:hypothetical protein
MTISMWLKISVIGLPLVGALAIWRWGDKLPLAPRWLAAIIFGLIGLSSLALFLLNRYYACIFASGKQNCIFDGLATLSLLALSIVLARGSLGLKGVNKNQGYILMLLLGSAWAGMGLAGNLLEILIFFNLFIYVIHRWLKQEGLTFRLLVLRDDYRDDSK